VFDVQRPGVVTRKKSKENMRVLHGLWSTSMLQFVLFWVMFSANYLLGPWLHGCSKILCAMNDDQHCANCLLLVSSFGFFLIVAPVWFGVVILYLCLSILALIVLVVAKAITHLACGAGFRREISVAHLRSKGLLTGNDVPNLLGIRTDRRFTEYAIALYFEGRVGEDMFSALIDMYDERIRRHVSRFTVEVLTEIIVSYLDLRCVPRSQEHDDFTEV